jgi:ferredoxin-thioredoxin reductase catalytic subunit
MTLKEKMQAIAEANGAVLSENADKIIKVKERNIDEYACPCYPDDKEHYCMSQLCKTELMTKGRCHCGLFKRNKETNNALLENI